MGVGNGYSSNVPMPTTAAKFGKKDDQGESNPFGYAQENTEHYWYVHQKLTGFIFSYSVLHLVPAHRALQDSADRLRKNFEALGPDGGYLSTQKARDVLVKTGLEKDQLRQIWNLSDIDRDGLFDHDEYVVAMFLCDAVIQKGRPIPTELPVSVIPPSKRKMTTERKHVTM
jgi:EH domain-containing protein 1